MQLQKALAQGWAINLVGSRGGARGAIAPQKFFLAPPVAPKIFRVTSCHCIEIIWSYKIAKFMKNNFW